MFGGIGPLTLREAVTEMMSREEVLLGVDFDGTLAPLVEHPDLAVPDSEGMAILRSLAMRPGILVAVVSGRALNDLSLRLGEVSNAVLIGEHGNDTGEDVATSPVLEEARTLIMSLLQTIPRATMESKPSSVTFHTRNVAPDMAASAITTIRNWIDAHDDITLLEGKQVLELTVATRNKGEAIADLAVEAEGVIYVGDDVTDETVFESLGPADIGVKVGPGPTAARYRVDDVAGVVDLLRLIDLASTRWR